MLMQVAKSNLTIPIIRKGGKNEFRTCTGNIEEAGRID
jgi:hypothetical protein